MRCTIVKGWMLSRRAPFSYWWGNFDHGSTPVRDEAHPHYNSYTQFPREETISGDLFPIYARGWLWIMSNDLFTRVARSGDKLLTAKAETHNTTWDDDELAEVVTHPDDPLLGVLVRSLVWLGYPVNIDDRDSNVFSLNPSCNSTYSGIHDRTMAVHHVTPEIIDCMWNVDRATANEARNPRDVNLTSLCACAVEVEEEEDDDPLGTGLPFSYPSSRFHDE